MTRAFGACLIGALLAACGPEGLPPTELAAVCATDEPLRLLALEPGEVLFGPVVQLGDRTIYSISRHEPDGEVYLLPTSFAALWSTGPCGESPAKLDPEARYSFTREEWPGLLFARSVDGDDVLVVDPLGVSPSHVVFADIGDHLGWTDAGLIAARPVDEYTDALYLHPWPADPRNETATPVLLLEGVLHSELSDPYAPNVLEIVADALLVRTDGGDLVRVSLPDGEVSLVQAGVWDFAARGDGRWIVWQDIKPIETEVPEVFAGEVYLRDTSDDSDTFLAETALVYSWQAFGSAIDILKIKLGATFTAPERIYSLDTLASVDLPEGRTLQRVLSDGRWLIGDGIDESGVYDPASGGTVELYLGPGRVVRTSDEGLEVLDVVLCCLTVEAQFDQGPLWFVQYNGTRTLLAEQASRYTLRLADDRRLTTLEIGNDGLGQLVLVGPDAQAATQLDDRVFLGAQPSHVHDGAVVYSVDDGERTGVWLAKPAK